MNYKLASGRCCPKFITENRKVFLEVQMYIATVQFLNMKKNSYEMEHLD